MNETAQQNLANEISQALNTLNGKLREAKNAVLYVAAKITEFVDLENPKIEKRIRIEAALLQPITPNGEN